MRAGWLGNGISLVSATDGGAEQRFMSPGNCKFSKITERGVEGRPYSIRSLLSSLYSILAILELPPISVIIWGLSAGR